MAILAIPSLKRDSIHEDIGGKPAMNGGKHILTGWARMRQHNLKQFHPRLYRELFKEGELPEYCRKAAERAMKLLLLVPKQCEENGDTPDQAWRTAEEIALREFILCRLARVS